MSPAPTKHVLDNSKDDAVAAVTSLSGGGVHHSFEAVGMELTAEQSHQMLRRGGQATVIGVIPVGTMVENPRPWAPHGIRADSLRPGSNQLRTDMPRYVDMYPDGRLHLDEMVSETIRLEDINEGVEDVNDGFDDMRSVHVARSVVTFG